MRRRWLASVMVIDTSALVAILRREAEADTFLGIIGHDRSSQTSSVSLLETSMVLAGRSGGASSWAELDELIDAAGIQIVAHDLDLVEGAREAFLRFGKGHHPAALNLGDCASTALARARGLKLLFKGDDFPKTHLEAAA